MRLLFLLFLSSAFLDSRSAIVTVALENKPVVPTMKFIVRLGADSSPRGGASERSKEWNEEKEYKKRKEEKVKGGGRKKEKGKSEKYEKQKNNKRRV